MSEELNREILEELKKMNERLDKLEKTKGLSPAMKIIALLFGFLVIGPAVTFFIRLY
ncbi:hypothetical protein [Halobacillus sp. Marseille-Q1614]|uniref:hypothetical protein n=1 Tax=Halobacillus sp. Marseille-Q1614 TaxID=2709134 RepID=UPI00156DA453|nr:hypothetical protein [Halobacillus sp. Marseille-Q1614]